MDTLEQDDRILLTDETGEEAAFEFLDLVEYEDEEYIVLLPLDTDNNDVVILQIRTLGNGEEEYAGIEDEQLLQAVYACFKEKYKDTIQFTE